MREAAVSAACHRSRALPTARLCCPNCPATHRRRRGVDPRWPARRCGRGRRARSKPRYLISRSTRVSVRVNDDHDDEWKHRRHTGLDEQRNVLDDHGIVGHRCDDLRATMRHQRMHDPIQAWRAVPRRLKAIAASAGRFSAPSGQQDVLAERVDQSLASPSVPGSTTSRAMTSPSTMIPPSSLNVEDTVDFPAPIPPDRPMRSTAPVCQDAKTTNAPD